MNRSVSDHGEKGSALVIALLIIVIMSLMGLAFALVAETENRIAVNERHQAQALYVAEGALRVVKNWFDDPTTGYLVPTTSQVNRSLRYVDPDGDGTYQLYSTAAAPWNVIYRSGTNDLFDKPYRGGPAKSLEGTQGNPDVRISDAGSAGEIAYLNTLNDTLFPNFPAVRLRARVRQIDVYAPPIITVNVNRVRFGMASAMVRVGIFEHFGLPEQVQVAERVVRMVLNEAPYPGPLGPLQSDKSIKANGDFNVHWGDVTASNSANLASNIDSKLNSGVPWYDIDRIWGIDNNDDGVADDYNNDGTIDFNEWFDNVDNSIEDPWLKFMFGNTWNGGGIDDGLQNTQPYKFGPYRPPTPPGVPVVVDADHSNVFIRVNRQLFPNVDYQLWKSVALQGGKNIYYYVYDAGTGLFRENGTGTATSVPAATNGRVGLHFFDTTDANPPKDNDGDGFYDNLTPDVSISGGWWSGGFIFLNARDIRTTGLGNVPKRVMNAPAEPFIDFPPHNGVLDPNEYFLNLNYPSAYVGNNLFYNKAHWTTPASAPPGVVWDSQGPDRLEAIHMYGVLYTNGQWRAQGNAVYYGAVLAKEGVSETTPGTSAGTPDIFFDQRIAKGLWPPSDIKVPRVIVSLWETDL